MSSNFDYLKLDELTSEFFQSADLVESQYASKQYSAQLTTTRKIAENVTKEILDLAYMPNSGTFDQNLRLIKKEDLLLTDAEILDRLYHMKRLGNESTHELEGRINYTKEQGLAALQSLSILLHWFAQKYAAYSAPLQPFIEPEITIYDTTSKRVIYSVTGDNSSGKWPAFVGREKVGEATLNQMETNTTKNSSDLRAAAEARIKQYMGTTGVKPQLEWAELAWSDAKQSYFTDHAVHQVLDNSHVKRDPELVENGGREWFITKVDTVKSAISAVKAGQPAINVPATDKKQKIVLRPEQKDAVQRTEKVFKTKHRMLWNAKMRFGKTLSALKLIKNEQYERVLIMTHRPVVKDSWYEDFKKIGMPKVGYQYGSKTKGLSLEQLNAGNQPFIYFASIQDLRGSKVFNGKVGDKNELIKDISWSLVIIDEAHEGTQTDLAQNVINGVTKPETRVLELSGTPFNLIDKYDQDQVYTWDYVMEQQAKLRWSVDHPDKDNPYRVLPKVSMYTFEMKQRFGDSQFQDTMTKAFNFHEFFRVNDAGKFVYESKVKQFLDNISNPSGETNYPFAIEEFRNKLRHTLWLMPSVRSAKAMEKLLNEHNVFGFGYTVVNVVDHDSDNETTTYANDDDLNRVRRAIGDHPAQTRTITLTVRKLTTGVNIPQWTGVLFLSNTNSAMQYLQAAFRAQTPFSDKELGMKENCYIFDFAPDRALTVMADSTRLNTGAGKLTTKDQKDKMGEMLNFLPIIGEQNQGMQPYKVDSLLTQLKKVYAEKAVRTGFDDDSLYNDELLKMDDVDLNDFNDLKALVGTTKAEKKKVVINVNNQGLTDEEYNQAERAKKRKLKERSEEDKALIKKQSELKKQRRTMISVLRSISIRIPMMIYGMDIDIGEDVDIPTFINQVDAQSWEEFMPKGVTKDKFRQFAKYYDSDIFIEAGRIIRRRVKEMDKLEPLERTKQIAELFGTFKNPDKETVLTPWRVVNMQLGKTIGGYSYFDDEYQYTSNDGVSVNRWIDTDETAFVFKPDTKILEINSKSGLYPLYAATSLFYQEQQRINERTAGSFNGYDEENSWQRILKKNIYVIAKTPMAKTITQRTLAGYKGYMTNIAFVDGIIDTTRESIDDGVKRIQEVFTTNMKFNVVIGNPPYQEQSGGTSSSDKPIYHLFMDMAYKLAPKVVLITPGRFLFRAGATPRAWNEKMLNDTHLKVVDYEQNSDKIFPKTDIKGGVVITLRDTSQNFAKIETFTAYSELRSILDKVSLDLKSGNLSQEISTQNKLNLERLYQDYPAAASEISSDGRDRRMESNIFTKLSIFKEERGSKHDIKVLGLISNKRLYRYVDRKYVDLNHPNLNKYKVLLPKSNGSGALGEVLSTPLIGTPLIGYTRSFIGIGAFEQKVEAEAALKYVKSKFTRTLLGVLKITQDNNPDKWSKVPLQNFTADSDIDWMGSVEDIDKQLFAKYHLTQQEIDFINKKVQAMD
ncbi:restriction endonuclease [Lactiplantibacillus plantarum]|uniref:Eco57I restriction-modification methylase domain-containing protein n=1 Tax=Lactiplantibacillus plantarum TaxID=1590 RepID=UPI000C19A3CE|nr:Eco57I restriction-modification methylase domain-containing protein [Lactiplantibacillus plantarum]PKX51885.1 restriction endonuclease [Lactiplantibacillus plantarum]